MGKLQIRKSLKMGTRFSEGCFRLLHFSFQYLVVYLKCDLIYAPCIPIEEQNLWIENNSCIENYGKQMRKVKKGAI